MIETENRIVVARVCGKEWDDKVKGYNSLIIRRISSEDVMYRMMTVANNTVLCT